MPIYKVTFKIESVDGKPIIQSAIAVDAKTVKKAGREAARVASMTLDRKVQSGATFEVIKIERVR